MPTAPLESGHTRRGDQRNSVPLSERPICGNCKLKEPIGGEKFKACQRCMFIRYCSRECQRAHWKVHKQVCKNITKIVQTGISGEHSIETMMKVKQDAAVKHQSQATLQKAVKTAKAPWYTLLAHTSSTKEDPTASIEDLENTIDESRLAHFMSKIYLFSSGFVCKNLSLNRGKGCLFLHTNVSWETLTRVEKKDPKQTKGKDIQISLVWGWDSLKMIRRKGGLYSGKLVRMLPHKVDDEMINAKISKCSSSSFPLIVLCDPSSQYVLENVKDNLIEHNGRVQEGGITQLVIECRILDPQASSRYAQRMPVSEILCFDFGS